MDYKEIKNILEQLSNENYEEYVKAIISFEKNINNKQILAKLYNEYMENDSMNLLNDEFDNMIDEIQLLKGPD